MIKAIFGIVIFFFFVAVLFYGISFILGSIKKIFTDNPKEITKSSSVSKQSSNIHDGSHILTYYDPALDKKVEQRGEILKCYEEHNYVWIKFQIDKDQIKVIKADCVSAIENLNTNESKYNPQQISEYFNRFL